MTPGSLLACAPVQRAIERLTQEPAKLERETLTRAVRWLDERAPSGSTSRLRMREALRAAQAHLIDSAPRESLHDFPDWYTFEWPGYVPGMLEANYYVRDGASQMSLHALAVMRAVAEEERERARGRRRKADATSPELKKARDALASARRTVAARQKRVATLEGNLKRHPERRGWPFWEQQIAEAQAAIPAALARVAELERALLAITVKSAPQPSPGS